MKSPRICVRQVVSFIFNYVPRYKYRIVKNTISPNPQTGGNWNNCSVLRESSHRGKLETYNPKQSFKNLVISLHPRTNFYEQYRTVHQTATGVQLNFSFVVRSLRVFIICLFAAFGCLQIVNITAIRRAFWNQGKKNWPEGSVRSLKGGKKRKLVHHVVTRIWAIRG